MKAILFYVNLGKFFTRKSVDLNDVLGRCAGKLLDLVLLASHGNGASVGRKDDVVRREVHVRVPRHGVDIKLTIKVVLESFPGTTRCVHIKVS